MRLYSEYDSLENLSYIGAEAFFGCEGENNYGLGEIKLNVETIESNAFYKARNLTKVVISGSVRTIVYNAFYGCRDLTEVEFEDGVTTIGYNAFAFTKIESLRIPKTVTIIEQKDNLQPFEGCRNLTSIEVDPANTIYDSRNNCNAIIRTASNELVVGCLETVIPDGITTIGMAAFRSQSEMTSISLPNSVTKIDMYAFFGCSKLATVAGTNNLTTIEDYAFQGCAIEQFEIPEACTRIGNKCFSGAKLKSIDLPENTVVGSDAFLNCKNLISVVIKNDNHCNQSSIFTGCSALKNVTIMDGVTRLGYGLFNNCTSLEAIALPSTILSIGDNALSGCSALKEIKSFAEIAPSVTYYTFGTSSGNYTGRKTYSTGENTLYTLPDATGYDKSAWTTLLSSNNCGFTLSATLPPKDAVDLGLPSGVLWRKMNVGASAPEEYGLYFSWGNTDGHGETDEYDWSWSNYKTTDGYSVGKPGITLSDDAANVNLGGNWRIPTKKEFEELDENCTSELITVNNINGIKFTSNINGKSIFLPFGYYMESDYYAENRCYKFVCNDSEKTNKVLGREGKMNVRPVM